MAQWHLIIDVAKCEDCNNCLLACKDEHVGNDWPGYAAPQPLHGQRWMNIRRKERGSQPLIDVAYLPTPCMHCRQAPCLDQAQAGAVYRREDGIVLIDPQKARGQKQIVSACPYGAVFWNAELDIPQKCTLCAHLLDQGWPAPRCVQACPTGALSVVRASQAEFVELVRQEQLQTLHPRFETGPGVRYKNLDRFQSCFIAGSVAVEENGVLDCAAQARVTLHREGLGPERTRTDAFGDFKFDGLEKGSGPWVVEISRDAFKAERMEVQLNDSVNLGVIVLESL